MKISSTLKIVFAVVGVVIIISVIKAFDIYDKAFRPNVDLGNAEFTYFYIDKNDSLESVLNKLDSLEIIEEFDDFLWVVDKKAYGSKIYPGKYKITNQMTNNMLVNMLRSGNQEIVWFVLSGKIRSIEQIAEKASKSIVSSKSEIEDALTDPMLLDSLGFTSETIMGMFIPNSYQLYWYTTAEDFVFRMKKEYDKFWNSKREAAAKNLKLSKNEVITIASILSEETNKSKEMPTMAGVYINRLRIGMRLQSDPTIRFAHNNFEMRRVLKRHLTIDSPYNTYRNYGLTPGPICVPPIEAIDAVLDYETHDYLYFCAKEDFSGYHNFARTLAQHNKNAKKYHRALNKRNILN
jgi:UPF0755 protein